MAMTLKFNLNIPTNLFECSKSLGRWDLILTLSIIFFIIYPIICSI